MNELSLHILDIIQNSIKAKATVISVSISLDKATDEMTIEIKDNGCGIEEKMLENVTDPFVSSRTTRKVGMGLSLFKQTAEAAGGSFKIASKIDIGTYVSAVFNYKHIDCPPLGNLTDTLLSMVIGNETIDFIYTFRTGDGEMLFDSKEIKNILGEVPVTNPDVFKWMQSSINEEINEICGGYEL